MLGHSGQGHKKDVFLLQLPEMGPLAPNLVHYRDECRGQHAPRASISASVIWLHVCTSPLRTAAALRCAARWKSVRGRVTRSPYKSSLSYTPREEEAEWGVRRGSLQPCRFLSKEEQEECWSGSRVSDAKHNTAFMASGHLHNASEEKKCTLLCQQLFQYYGNALFRKKVNWGFCVAQWWSFVVLPDTHLDWAQTKLISPRVCVCAMSAAARVSARKLRISECVQAAVYPLSVCCQLSDWKLLFQMSNKRLSPKCSLCADTLCSLLNEAKPVAQRQSVNKWAPQWRFH